jgi:hypothetical protein
MTADYDLRRGPNIRELLRLPIFLIFVASF